MNRQTFQFEIITPSFCAGAKPEKEAEIRAASIRGQLRWWFRVLGGFKSLAPMCMRDQETMIFGATAGGEGTAGQLIVRVVDAPTSIDVRDDAQMKATVYDDRGYFLWPLRSTKGPPPERAEILHSRAVINAEALHGQTCPRFSLHLIWRGRQVQASDLRALMTVYGHLGALGFRSRRAMGALSLTSSSITLDSALNAFSARGVLTIRSLPATSAFNAIDVLSKWLKKWRAHGRSGDLANGTPANQKPPFNAGWGFAQSDHDAADLHLGPGYRAALGMPMMAKYGDWSAEAPQVGKQIKGRFASPVLLRPNLTAGNYRALIIFVDNRQWDTSQQVFLTPKGQATQIRNVSLDLYNAMKADKTLSVFP